MVNIAFHPSFQKVISKIKETTHRERILKQIAKIQINPEIGKPMKHNRTGTRELYIAPFRLSYTFLKEEDKVVILDIYHKDEQ